MTTRAIIITAIIAPIFVGLVLLLVEYSFFVPTGDSTREIEKKAEEVVKSLGEGKSSTRGSYVEPDVGDLETLFNVARKVYGTTERNTEFVKLIELSLSEEKPGFAFAVAKEVYGTTERNEQFVKIIDKSIELQRFGLAMEAAAYVYGTTERNREYGKIIAAGMKKREKNASNKKMQPTAK